MIGSNAVLCSTCSHKGICKYEKDMEGFCKSIDDVCRLMEYSAFRADIKCRSFRQDMFVSRGGKV